jgi:hypothetical protein
MEAPVMYEAFTDADKGDDVSDLLWSCETLDWHGGDERRFIYICTGEAREHFGALRNER